MIKESSKDDSFYIMYRYISFPPFCFVCTRSYEAAIGSGDTTLWRVIEAVITGER